MDNIVSEIRQKFGVTQEELAHVLGVSFTSVNAWEGGKRTPQEHMMAVLSDLLESDQLPQTASETPSKGFSRTDAGFVSSLLDYNGLRDPLPYTHGIGRWYGSLPSFLVSDVLKFIQTDFGKMGPVLANFCGSPCCVSAQLQTYRSLPFARGQTEWGLSVLRPKGGVYRNAQWAPETAAMPKRAPA